MILSLCACGDIEIGVAPAQETVSVPAEAPAAGETLIEDAVPADIVLTGSSASSEGSRVSVNGGEIKILSGGEYNITGSLEGGRIVINTGEDAKKVVLNLCGAEISNPEGAAIYVERAKSVHIVLAEGSKNSIVSGTGSKIVPADVSATGAAVYSESDLIFEAAGAGTGSLEITAYINNGITCKDDLKIEGGNITVNAANSGIRGNESVRIYGGVISVSAKKDGIKTTSAVKEGKGYVEINGGEITVNSEGDGISAVTALTVNGGNISVATSGRDGLISCKALKCDGSISVNGGNVSLVSASEGISAKHEITLAGGSIALVSDDDGIFSDSAVLISGGEYSISAGNDGIKAGIKGSTSGDIHISGGSITLECAAVPLKARGSLHLYGGTVFGTGSCSKIKNISEDSIPSVSFCLRTDAQRGASLSIDGTEFSLVSSRSFNFIFACGGGVSADSSYSLQ